MDLLTVVVKPTWKEFLIDLVSSNQMDPWDVDITAVADAYLVKVRQLQALDLRLPANVILACALLLRFKAESLSFEQEEPEEYYEEPALIQEEVPELVFRANRPRRRRITLQELLAAVEQVMKQGERPQARLFAPKELNIELPKVDMNELMAEVHAKAHKLKDAEGVLLFSDLVRHGWNPASGGGLTLNDNGANGSNGHNGDGAGNGNGALSQNGNGANGRAIPISPETALQNEIIRINAARFLSTYETYAEGVAYHLIPVLHLAQENKLHVWQDENFGEIFVKVLPEIEISPAVAAKAN
ncbi:segregation/condensation protein A [Candidatus Micrarchaeota archaeon]|nr:segregation/condensation protein A [Candidatus Micrarchaeota archaeon]